MSGRSLCLACRRQEQLLEKQTTILNEAASRAESSNNMLKDELNSLHEETVARLEEYEEQRRADAEEFLDSLERNTEQRRQDIANSWKLQAEARREEGARLASLGLIAEGIHLLQRSARENPGDLATWIHLADAYTRTSQSVERQHAIEQQLRLLSSSKRLNAFRTTLEQIQTDDVGPLRLLQSTLTHTLPAVTTDDPRDLLRLLDLNMRPVAILIAGQLHRDRPTLATLILLAGITGDQSPQFVATSIRTFLLNYTSDGSRLLRSAYAEAETLLVKRLPNKAWNAQVLVGLRNEVIARYKILTPSIHSQIETYAYDSSLRTELSISDSNMIFKFAIGSSVVSFYLFPYVVYHNLDWLPSIIGTLLVPLMIGVPLAVFFAVSRLGESAMRSMRATESRNKTVAALLTTEREIWRSVLDAEDGPERR